MTSTNCFQDFFFHFRERPAHARAGGELVAAAAELLADRAHIAASLFERMLTRTLPSGSSSKKTATITPSIARR